MNQKTIEFRQNIADQFLKCLTEKGQDWKKGWFTTGRQYNAVTGKPYKGLNFFSLSMVAVARGTDDPRWATFKQIKDQGWKLEKGAKGHPVEYWAPYDYVTKKTLSWAEYERLMQNPDLKSNLGIISRYYYVFNASNIEGIPPFEKYQGKQIVSDELIDKISGRMGVDIKEGQDRAFYRISEDTIYLPPKERFYSDYEYNATALHELSHATGAPHRLHRDIQNGFGSEKYAYEELVAEISSCFMGEHLQIEQSQEHIENHKAYVQSWISEIKEKPEQLIKAIKDADQAANYLEYQAELISEQEYQKSVRETKEVNTEDLKPKMTQEEYLGKLGLASPVDDYMLDKMKLPHGQSKVAEKQMFQQAVESSREYHDARQNAINEFKAKVADGKIVEKTAHEASLEKALYGHQDNQSVQASRRILEKKGVDLNSPELRKKMIRSDIINSGFKPTDRMINNIQKLSEGRDSLLSLRGIQHLYKSQSYDPNVEAIIKDIAAECQSQELVRMMVPEM